jgi:hypothetical protein
VRPNSFVVVEGLLNFSSHELCAAHDIRVFLAPPEELRRTWKLTRDCTRRGYTTHEVIAELDRREEDVERYIPAPAASADIIVSFAPNSSDNPELLDADLILRGHPPSTPTSRRSSSPTGMARPSVRLESMKSFCSGFPGITRIRTWPHSSRGASCRLGSAASTTSHPPRPSVLRTSSRTGTESFAPLPVAGASPRYAVCYYPPGLDPGPSNRGAVEFSEFRY